MDILNVLWNVSVKSTMFFVYPVVMAVTKIILKWKAPTPLLHSQNAQLFSITLIFRSSHQRWVLRKGVLRNFPWILRNFSFLISHSHFESSYSDSRCLTGFWIRLWERSLSFLWVYTPPPPPSPLFYEKLNLNRKSQARKEIPLGNPLADINTTIMVIKLILINRHIRLNSLVIATLFWMSPI